MIVARLRPSMRSTISIPPEFMRTSRGNSKWLTSPWPHKSRVIVQSLGVNIIMMDKIKNKIIHKKSKNYKAPTKADAITWANATWDSISADHVINGCKKFYMDPNDLDEKMAIYDDKYEEVFAEGFTFKPLPEHIQESDEEDSDDVGMFAYWH